MRDFMDFLGDIAQEQKDARALDEFPQIVARAQAQNRAAAANDPMLMAGLVQQRPLQEAAPVAPVERVEKAENPWWFFTQGILLGAGMATLLLIGILI